MMKLSALLVALTLLGTSTHAAPPRKADAISGVTVKPAFFNPTLGQKETISFTLAKAGKLSVLVLDRDGFQVRNLVAGKSVKAGKMAMEWDGKDDAGAVVTDEAYSLKIDLTAGGSKETYFPATEPVAGFEVKPKYFDAQSGALAYDLPAPSRVHVEAGTAEPDARSGEMIGPILKVVVNRQPRAGGSVVETWQGLDESQTIRVSSLPHMVISIFATPLPSASMIAIGNREKPFLRYAAERRGKSLLPPERVHAHHQGLTAFQDVSPPLRFELSGVAEHDGRLRVSSPKVHLAARIEGPTAEPFSKLPAEIGVFIDDRLVARIPAPSATAAEVEVPVTDLAQGEHVLAANWATKVGPVAAYSRTIEIAGAPASK